ncbi:MAG: TonB-dependent receptor [Proteobacteria bacterium]|nr:TonB-dependent receptor [Pseudomonadota bacterium]
MRHTIKSWRNYRCLLATTALVAVFPATAFAAPDDAAAVNEDPDAPAEIVVSARKQNESALEVPIAVSAFSESVLQDRLATGIADVADFTPGFQMQQSFGRGFDRPIIRGASNIIQADGKVGIFLNGAPYLGDFSSLDLAAVQQIEVIKGPQSAVFGRGTLSGAINVTLKRPGDKLEGKISATMGNYERREISGFVSAPVLPGVGIQVGAKSYDIAGQFVNSAVPGERLGDQNTVQYTAGVYLDPAPDLSANVLWLHQRDRDGMYAIGLQTAANNNCYLTTRPYYCGTAKLPQSYAINSNKLQYPGTYRNADRFIGDVNWDILGSGYNLSFQVGYSKVKEVVGTDQTYDGREFYILSSAATCAFVPLTNQLCSQSAFNTTDGTDRKTQTYELRLSSPASQRLRWRIGGFVSHDDKRALSEWLEATELGLDALADTVTVRNQAVFGGVDFDVSDTLTLGAELRHQVDKVRNFTPSYRAGDVFSAAYLATLVGSNANQIVGVAGVREGTFKATLPRVTLNWRPSNDLSFYAQFAQGNAPGGFNQIGAPQSTYDEEKLTNYEVGLKTTRWGFSYLNLSAFWQEYRNQVLTNTYTTGTAINSYRANIGSTRIRGLELEGAYPLAGRALRVQFNYTFLDAKITRGIEADQALVLLGTACKVGTSTNLDLPGCRNAASIAGKTPPMVSKHTGAIGLRSEVPLSDTINVFAGVDVVYRSKFFDILNLIDTGNSTRVNIQAGIETSGGLRIQAYARNLFDDKTPVGILRYIDRGPGVAKAPTGDTNRAFAITPSRKPEFGVTVTQTF